jgi:hypothetical protein
MKEFLRIRLAAAGSRIVAVDTKYGRSAASPTLAAPGPGPGRVSAGREGGRGRQL